MCVLKGKEVLLIKKTSKNPWQKTSEFINTVSLKISSNSVRNMGTRGVSLLGRNILRNSTRVGGEQSIVSTETSLKIKQELYNTKII